MTIKKFTENWDNILKDVSIFTVMNKNYYSGACLYSDSNLAKLIRYFGPSELEDFTIEYQSDGCGSHYFEAIFLIDEDIDPIDENW